jgi:hypothetical protein
MLYVEGRDEAMKSERQKWAQRVIDHFAGRLPECRVLVYLDDTDPPTLKRGPAHRGLFQPIDKHHFSVAIWSRKLALTIQSPAPMGPDPIFHCDSLVYLFDSTCNTEEMTTMSLAHELHHSIQHNRDPQTWAWNTLPSYLCDETIAALGLQWKDIPIEREARFVAKSATESLLGFDRTAQYIESRIAANVTDEDTNDWHFIRGIDTSDSSYNCARATGELYRRMFPFWEELQQLLERTRYLPEFKHLRLNDILKDSRAC